MNEKLEINWTATLFKWKTAIGTFRLNITEIARESRVTRQHINGIIAETSVPSILIAERIDKAIDAAVERRAQIARDLISSAGGSNE